MTRPDWIILVLFMALALLIGLWSSRKAGRNTEEYFLSGRKMPWWLLGISIVATTFSADTPNLVTNIVRQHGVSGNWMWWAFLLTGMLTVFVYARLWRRSGVMTDLGFYELRYGGPAATFLRSFRALYLGVFFNVLIMATVLLAGIKMAGVLLGWSPLQTVLLAGGITLIYSVLGGLRSVLWTDLIMFILALTGAIVAAVFAVRQPEVGGLKAMITHFEGTSTLNFLPDLNDPALFVPLLLIPLTVQWWSVWYPGSEPGGGGYAAQRMLAAPNERHALGAVLLFNVAHYALRPWPWILVALASIMVFPDIDALREAFPNMDHKVVKDDLAYPAMLSLLPPGWLGLVATSLIAAFMSTISTHLNWGSSYVVHDFWNRYIHPDASQEEQVKVGRWSTVILMGLAILMSLLLESALGAFNILLQIGAGTGLIYILRWFWWRINAWTEIAGMAISFLVAIYFAFFHKWLGGKELPDHIELVLGVGITTVGWLTVTLLTQPERMEVLTQFYRRIRPAALGWRPVLQHGLEHGTLEATVAHEGRLPLQLLAMSIACVFVYGALFTTGNLLYGYTEKALIPGVITFFSGILLFLLARRILNARDGEG